MNYTETAKMLREERERAAKRKKRVFLGMADTDESYEGRQDALAAIRKNHSKHAPKTEGKI
jgi:hypothetical protein